MSIFKLFSGSTKYILRLLFKQIGRVFGLLFQYMSEHFTIKILTSWESLLLQEDVAHLPCDPFLSAPHCILK